MSCQPSSFSSAFTSYISGFTIFGEVFAYVTVFNPTIEAVTFRLHAWCMLGAFLLLAFTHLGLKEFWKNGVKTHVNSWGKNSLYQKNSPQRRIEPMTLHQAGQWALHTTNKLFRPPVMSVTFTNSGYSLPSYPMKIYFLRHLSHFITLFPLFFFVGGIFSVGAFIHTVSEWIYATAGTKRFGIQCLRFISFHVYAHIMTHKSSALKEGVTCPGIQVTVPLGSMRLWSSECTFRSPRREWTENTTLCRILDSTNICYTSCKTFVCFFSWPCVWKLFKNCNQRAQCSGTQSSTCIEKTFFMYLSLLTEVYCHFLMQMHSQLKPVTICSNSHRSASGRTWYIRRKDF